MVFLLFLFSGISIINLVLTLFFPYPAPLIGIGLQTIFFILSVFVFISRIRKKKGLIRSFIMTAYHSSAFVLILYVFFTITLPNREAGESDAFAAGINGLLRQFQSDPSPLPSYRTHNQNDTSLKISMPPESEDSVVEDPF